MLPALAAIVYRLLWIGLPLVLYAMSTTTGSSSSLFVGILQQQQQQQQQQPEEQTAAAASGAAVLGDCETEGPKAPPLPCTSLSHVQTLVDRAIRMDRNDNNNNNNIIHIRLDACNGATLIPESSDDGDDDEEEEGVVMVRGVTGRERIVIACENTNIPCYLFGLFSVENAASLTFRNIALDGRSRSSIEKKKKKKNFAAAAAAAAPPAAAAAAARDSGPLLHVRGVPDVSVIGSFFLHGRSRSSRTTSAAEDDNSSNNNGGGGGGLIVQHGRRVRIRDSRFVGNTAARDGGGLYVDIASEDDDTNTNNDSSVVTLQNITFTDCHAGRYGGGAYIGGSDALDLNDAVWFERCTAERGGGGWFADDIVRTTSTKTRCNDCEIVGSSSGSSSNDKNDDNGYRNNNNNNNNNNNCGGGCAFVRIRCFNGPNHLPPPCGGGFCESRLVLRSLHAANAASTGPRALLAAPVSVVQGGGGDDGTTNNNNGRCGGSGGGSDDDAPPTSTTSTNTRLPPVFMDYKSSTGPSPVALDPQTEYYRLKIQDSLWCAF